MALRIGVWLGQDRLRILFLVRWRFSGLYIMTNYIHSEYNSFFFWFLWVHTAWKSSSINFSRCIPRIFYLFVASEMFLGDASGNLLILRLIDGSYRNLNFPSSNFTGLTLDDENVYLADISDTYVSMIENKKITTLFAAQVNTKPWCFKVVSMEGQVWEKSHFPLILENKLSWLQCEMRWPAMMKFFIHSSWVISILGSDLMPALHFCSIALSPSSRVHMCLYFDVFNIIAFI